MLYRQIACSTPVLEITSKEIPRVTESDLLQLKRKSGTSLQPLGYCFTRTLLEEEPGGEALAKRRDKEWESGQKTARDVVLQIRCGHPGAKSY